MAVWVSGGRQPFLGITLIEDAYTLWAKLKAEQGTASFNPDFDEEVCSAQSARTRDDGCAR